MKIQDKELEKDNAEMKKQIIELKKEVKILKDTIIEIKKVNLSNASVKNQCWRNCARNNVI